MAEKKLKSRYIACILYPDNSEQMDFMKYLITHEECVWILHKSENQTALPDSALSSQLEEGHDFKPHYHIMIHYKNAHYADGFCRSSCGCVKYAKAINDAHAYARYMIHDTYAALKAHKIEYNVEDVKSSSSDLWSFLYFESDGQSSLMAITDILQYAECCANYTGLMRLLAADGRSDLIKYASSHSYHVMLTCKSIWDGSH